MAGRIRMKTVRNRLRSGFLGFFVSVRVTHLLYFFFLFTKLRCEHKNHYTCLTSACQCCDSEVVCVPM